MGYEFRRDEAGRDAADGAYNAGKAERYIGMALDDLGPGQRKKVQIATKCANAFIDGQYVRSGRGDLILRQCEESLKNLRSDYVDLMIVHWPDPEVPYEETFGAQTRARVESNVSCLDWELTQEELQELDQAIEEAMG